MEQLVLPGRKFKPRKAPPPLEFETMCALADFMRLNIRPEVKWSHHPAGEKRAPTTANRLQRMGSNPGWPDYEFLDRRDGRPAFIEMKRGVRGVLTPHQRAFMDFCIQGHIRHALCHSYKEAEAVLRQWDFLRSGRVMA